MINKLSTISLVTGLISGIYSIITLISLFFLYLARSLSMHPFGNSEIKVLGYFVGFSVMWIYLIVWVLIIFVSIPTIAAIVCGSIDLAKTKSDLSNKKGRKLDIAGIALGASPAIVIGLYFIPGVSFIISQIPG
jgi:hypothetical protein